MIKLKINRNSFLFPLLFLLIFYSIAVWRYMATGKVFYLWNFGYLGTSIAFGIFFADVLPKKYAGWGRRITQLLIGTYLLLFVGFIKKENMQIEGFWFYLFSGVFAGATLHYFIAKICGPFIFNRGWCGWACWTAMILDFLPWKKPVHDISKKWSLFRYFHFFIVMGLVTVFFFVNKFNLRIYSGDNHELYWLLAGNGLYYLLGVFLAWRIKDNRAFCKYICPIPVFQKTGARFSLLKNEIEDGKCIDCGKCESNCPMQIKLLDYKSRGERILSTECILCLNCINLCPVNAVSMTFKVDFKKKV